MKLATTDSRLTITSQATMPSGVKFNGRADCSSVFPITPASSELIGSDRPIASTQVSRPMISASVITARMITPSEAPMARITPISRRRSSTFMLIVPVRPMLPTTAIRVAITSRKMISVLTADAAVSRKEVPDWIFKTGRLRCARCCSMRSIRTCCAATSLAAEMTR